jgi:hypothetical protein
LWYAKYKTNDAQNHEIMDEVYKFDVMPYSLQIVTPSTIINISHKANLILGMY